MEQMSLNGCTECGHIDGENWSGAERSFQMVEVANAKAQLLHPLSAGADQIITGVQYIQT